LANGKNDTFKTVAQTVLLLYIHAYMAVFIHQQLRKYTNQKPGIAMDSSSSASFADILNSSNINSDPKFHKKIRSTGYKHTTSPQFSTIALCHELSPHHHIFLQIFMVINYTTHLQIPQATRTFIPRSWSVTPYHGGPYQGNIAPYLQGVLGGFTNHK
jgi:hypothetical protein